MRIVGVDPGTSRTGWGVIECRANRMRGIAADVIAAGSSSKPLQTRLRSIFDELTQVVEKYEPDAFAVEDIFFARYANAALKLGHARGIVLLVAANAELPLHSYPPAIVKRTVAGRGASSKEQIARLVGAMLDWKALPGADATDALAIAITHAQAWRSSKPTSIRQSAATATDYSRSRRSRTSKAKR